LPVVVSTVEVMMIDWLMWVWLIIVASFMTCEHWERSRSSCSSIIEKLMWDAWPVYTTHPAADGFLAKYCWMQYRSWWMALTASLLLFPLSNPRVSYLFHYSLHKLLRFRHVTKDVVANRSSTFKSIVLPNVPRAAFHVADVTVFEKDWH
jgi:hypothetical protein